MSSDKNEKGVIHGLEPVQKGYNDFNSTTKLADDYDDDYNPFDNRVTDKPNSTMGSLAHLLKSSLGTGILAMPLAFSNAGLLFGALGTVIVGLLCTHCVHILVRTSHNICRKTRTPVLGFAETAEKVFAAGPGWMKNYATAAKNFVDYGLMATYYSAGCVYIVFISKTFHDIFHHFGLMEWNIRIYILMVMIPVILIGQLRSLKVLVPFSATANIFILVTFAITLYYMFNDSLEFSDKPLVVNWTKWPLFFATVIFAMEGIGAVMPVENAMQKPQHFLGCPGVLNTAMGTVIVLYAIIGFFGFIRFGDEIQGSITLNLPTGEPAALIAQILIGLAILFTFGLQFFVPMDILWRKIAHKFEKKNHNLVQVALRTGIMIVMAGVSIAVPNLDPFISLVGSVFFSSLGIFVPAVIESAYLYPNFGAFNWKLCKNIFLMLFSVIALVSGSFVSIREIIHIYTEGDKKE